MQSIEQRIAQKRLIGEMNDLNKNRVHCYQVIQDLSNPHLFYFLLRGNDDDDYAGGYYLGKIELPKDYPKTPGFFYMLTPSGRFTTDSKICLTNSGYHLETWTAMWSIRLMMLGFFSIFCSDDTTGISHIRESSATRKQKAQNSINFNNANYSHIFKRFDQYFKEDGTMRTSEKEIVEYISQLANSSHNKTHKKKKHKKIPEPKVDDVVEPKVENVEEPKVEDVEDPKVEDPKVDDVEEPKVDDVVEPKVENVEDPKVEDVEDPKVEDVVEPMTETKTKHEKKYVIKKKRTDKHAKFKPIHVSKCKNLDEYLNVLKKQTIYTFNKKLYRAIEHHLNKQNKQ